MKKFETKSRVISGVLVVLFWTSKEGVTRSVLNKSLNQNRGCEVLSVFVSDESETESTFNRLSNSLK